MAVLRKRMLVYSHDTFGLGNIRRMLAICDHLIAQDPTLSILLITGSPVIQELRLPERLDYIKLPCLTRSAFEGYDVKYLGTEIGETMRLRSDLILSAVANYKPDFFLVDKKPYGVKNELLMALNYVQLHLPATKCLLVLRDILDAPERTMQMWRKHGYDDALRMFYDKAFVLGMPTHFDLRDEYQLPADVAAKMQFCGYLRRQDALTPRHEIRAELGVAAHEKLVLVTPGGGQDGYEILSTYLDSLAMSDGSQPVRSVLVSGPELPAAQKTALRYAAQSHLRVHLVEFTRDLWSWMNASDLVVSMGGYNTVCELLALKKHALIIPRVRPAQEQLIRAERMAALGLFATLHPDALTPQRMHAAVMRELNQHNVWRTAFAQLDMNALPQMATSLGMVAPSVTRNDTGSRKRVVTHPVASFAV